MLAGDDKNSVLREAGSGTDNDFAYSAYGHRSGEHPASTHLGYNGELREAHTGGYLLGNGYRVFSPLLMRFNSPDSWSPFGAGGLNAYMYVLGNPIKYTDETGHMPFGKLFKTVSSKGRVVTGGSQTSQATVGVVAPKGARAVVNSVDDSLSGWLVNGQPHTSATRVTPSVDPSLNSDSVSRLGPTPSSTGSSSKTVTFAEPKASRAASTAPPVPPATNAGPSRASPNEPRARRVPNPLSKKQYDKLGPVYQRDYLDRGGVDPYTGFHGATQQIAIDVRKTKDRFK